MNQHDATARILKFLKGKGERFQSAYEDKHTVVLESFSGRFKFEFTVLQKEAMLGLEIYIFKDDYDQTMLKECLKGNWKPLNWERQDINWGKKGGVAVRFFTPFKWRNLSNDDLEKSLDGYRAVCDKVKPCLVQDDSAKAQKRRRNWGIEFADFDEAALKDCLQVYLRHKKLLDLIGVCLAKAEITRKWPFEKLLSAVEVFRKRVADSESYALSQYVDCNVFDVLRMGEHEIRHSNVLAWLLDATETHGLKDVFLQDFLAVVKSSAKKDNVVRADIKNLLDDIDFAAMRDFKVFREDDHEDIKLMSEDGKTIVVVENKWNADAGKNQLKRYRERVVDECKSYGDGWNAVYVFLTKNGKRPDKGRDDEYWVPMSYWQITKLVQSLQGKMVPNSASGVLVRQYLRVLQTDKDLIHKDDKVVKDVVRFCEDCAAIGALSNVADVYFQKVFDRIACSEGWTRDEDLDAGNRKCIAFSAKELSEKMKRSECKYCLELELGWTCGRVCCNLLRKECGKSDRKAIPWNCDRDKNGKLVQKTNIKNWKKFDVGGAVERRSLETMAKAAVKEVVDWVKSQNVSDIDKMRND